MMARLLLRGYLDIFRIFGKLSVELPSVETSARRAISLLYKAQMTRFATLL
jgi:hypothetical protein